MNELGPKPPYEPDNQVQRQMERKDLSNAERRESFDLEFYITDHSADLYRGTSLDSLRLLYADIKRDGVKSVRYDWNWREIEPQAGQYSEPVLKNYSEAKNIMDETGLEAPTVILSNPPEWAKKLYKESKEEFFTAFRQYAEQVKGRLAQTAGEKVATVQVLNELNNSIYNPVAVQDIPRLCQITREVFANYNPNIKLMVTVIAGNIQDFSAKRMNTGTGISNYLPQLKAIKDSFDEIAVDYYPGLWHLPANNEQKTIDQRMLEQSSALKRLRNAVLPRHANVFNNLEVLKQVFAEISTWGKDYELGEVGLPTNKPWGNEKKQRYFFDTFFRAFRELLTEMRTQKLALPKRIGLYSAIDEPPKTLLGKVLRKTPFPEHDLGMRFGDGKRKMILQGSPHAPEEQKEQQPSQLSKIIQYLK